MVPIEVQGLFDEFLTYNETRGDKGAGITQALRRLGVAPMNAVYIGDQVSDVEAGRAADEGPVAAAWGFTPVDELRAVSPDLLLTGPAQIDPRAIGDLIASRPQSV